MGQFYIVDHFINRFSEVKIKSKEIFLPKQIVYNISMLGVNIAEIAFFSRFFLFNHFAKTKINNLKKGSNYRENVLEQGFFCQAFQIPVI
jgi:hypothetical protein